jgi:hypothetical protein
MLKAKDASALRLFRGSHFADMTRNGTRQSLEHDSGECEADTHRWDAAARTVLNSLRFGGLVIAVHFIGLDGPLPLATKSSGDE